MKILCFVDTHGSLGALKEIKKKSKEADLILCAGDFTIFEEGIKHFLLEFDKINKPFLLIHGNHEDNKIVRRISKQYKNLEFIHGESVIIGNYVILGWGGGGFSRIDEDFEKKIPDFEEIIKTNNEKKLIFLAHAPPYGTKLDKLGKEHCGNQSFTEFIKEFKPILFVCGHFHENSEKEDKMKDSLIINPGPKGRIVDI